MTDALTDAPTDTPTPVTAAGLLPFDLKLARHDPEPYRAALARKGSDALQAFEDYLAADAEWLQLVPRVDELRAQTKVKGKPSESELVQLRMRREELKGLEVALQAAKERREELEARVPNPPAAQAPAGGEEDAVELRRVGETREGGREHTEIGRFEQERAVRLSGSRFGYLVGDTAKLALAVHRYALDVVERHGFTPVLPPVLVREEAMRGTGFLPTEATNLYRLGDEEPELYLTGTSEVALAGFHMGEIVDAAELPLRYAGLSTCFRREAGAAGKDSRGMFRVHQFQKVEMFAYVRPEESLAEHERILAVEEEILQGLGLPYRVVDVAAQDLGASAARKFDCEAWFPFQGRYREVTSCSNTTDFQARRLGVRMRTADGLEPVHTLNGTAVTDRAVLAVLENFDGEVPEVLWGFGAPERVER